MITVENNLALSKNMNLHLPCDPALPLQEITPRLSTWMWEQSPFAEKIFRIGVECPLWFAGMGLRSEMTLGLCPWTFCGPQTWG